MNTELLERLVPLKRCAILYCESINVCSDLLQLKHFSVLCIVIKLLFVFFTHSL